MNTSIYEKLSMHLNEYMEHKCIYIYISVLTYRGSGLYFKMMIMLLAENNLDKYVHVYMFIYISIDIYTYLYVQIYI
jgi:hypothetical protein